MSTSEAYLVCRHLHSQDCVLLAQILEVQGRQVVHLASSQGNISKVDAQPREQHGPGIVAARHRKFSEQPRYASSKWSLSISQTAALESLNGRVWAVPTSWVVLVMKTLIARTDTSARQLQVCQSTSDAHPGPNSLVNLEEQDEQDETDDVAAIEDLQVRYPPSIEEHSCCSAACCSSLCG